MFTNNKFGVIYNSIVYSVPEEAFPGRKEIGSPPQAQPGIEVRNLECVCLSVCLSVCVCVTISLNCLQYTTLNST